MAFDKLIISSIVGVAKSGNRMDQALDSLKDKLVQTVSSEIEKNLPVELPFSIGDAIQNGNVPTPTPALLLEVKPIPEPTKNQISDILDSIETTLNNTIKTKNQLQSSLETLTKPLDTLEKLSTTLSSTLTGLNTAITVIKVLPIPSSVPPGVGIPLSVINGFSTTLDTLKGVIDKTGGPLKVISPTIKQINQLIIPIVTKLNLLNPIFEGIIKLISFIRVLLLSGPNATQQQIDSVLQETSSKITESLEATGPTSNDEENKRLNQELLDRLDPNSNNPLFYKGFKLTIEYDPNNTYSFASRRVKGFKANSNLAAESNNPNETTASYAGVTLYNLDDDDGVDGADYSFAASPEVLIKEIEYKIDQYLQGEKYKPIGFPGEVNGQKIGYSGNIYQWNEILDEWVIIPDPTFQAIVIRSKFKRVHINLRRLEVYSNEYNKSFLSNITPIVEGNILPFYANQNRTIFIDWDIKTAQNVIVSTGSWINIGSFGQILAPYPAKAIIYGSLTSNFNVHTGQIFNNENNALFIPLTKAFRLSSITKVTLYNRIKATENISEGRINGFQIEFYKTTDDVKNNKNPILVIPITETLPKYDFIPAQIRDLQSL